MSQVDFRQERMAQAFFMLIPYVNFVFMIIWLFTWQKNIFEDLTNHTGRDFNAIYGKLKIGFILLILVIIPFIGFVAYIIGIILILMSLYNFSKEMEEHMQEEGTYDGSITKGLSFLAAGNAPTLQLLVNYHWKQHGYKPIPKAAK